MNHKRSGARSGATVVTTGVPLVLGEDTLDKTIKGKGSVRGSVSGVGNKPQQTISEVHHQEEASNNARNSKARLIKGASVDCSSTKTSSSLGGGDDDDGRDDGRGDNKEIVERAKRWTPRRNDSTSSGGACG